MASNETATPCQTEKTLSRRDCGYSGKAFKIRILDVRILRVNHLLRVVNLNEYQESWTWTHDSF